MLFPIQIVYNEIKEGGFVESRVEEIRALADLLSEMIRQFIKTKEELMRTTLKAQMELLTNRAKRLKISISEIKSEMDKFCIPEEARLVEESIGDKVVPYNGASIKEDDTISELSWKSRKMLEQEKEDFVVIGGEQIYRLFLEYATKMYLTEIEAKELDADAYFPRFKESDWKRRILSEYEEPIPYKHVEYVKKR